jgi:hypothetical protein
MTQRGGTRTWDKVLERQNQGNSVRRLQRSNLALVDRHAPHGMGKYTDTALMLLGRSVSFMRVAAVQTSGNDTNVVEYVYEVFRCLPELDH